MRDGRAADDVILHVVIDLPVLLGREVGHQVADVGRVERRGLRRHPAREIGVADDHHAVLGDDLVVLDGHLAVAAALGGEVHDHRAGLHGLDHVLGPELGRLAVGDQRRRDDDIHVGRKLAELRQLRLLELGARGLGVAADFRAVLLLFLEVEIDEFRAHRLRPARPPRAARRRRK